MLTLQILLLAGIRSIFRFALVGDTSDSTSNSYNTNTTPSAEIIGIRKESIINHIECIEYSS
jgi:hypothetical protein